ncbi:MAG TPA: CARDB domain-containing protein [Thermoanaerobaculia bacterium]|nr:CARDB domain-containing protein [Thermoanaerobaculia bacterium]
MKKYGLTYAVLLILAASLHAQVVGKDIIITNLSASPTAIAPGKSTSLSYRVYNQGTLKITESYSEKFYLSRDSIVDSQDKYLGVSVQHTTDLGANGGYLSVSNLAISVPSATTAGTYYFIVRGDATGNVAERYETNNDKAVKITVSSTVLSASTEEANNPLLISTGLNSVSLSNGTSYFKFEVESGYFYSFIVNSGYSYDHRHLLKSRGAPAVLYSGFTGSNFQAFANSDTLPQCKSQSTGALVAESSNPSYAKSAVMFFADPNAYAGRYYNYVHIDSSGSASSPVYIKLVKLSNKDFTAPFTGPIKYYNSFRHRADIDDSGYCTDAGHNGIDILPFNGSEVDFQRSIVPVISGDIIKTAYLGTASDGESLGYAVWVYNSTLNYTVVYAHLQTLSKTSGSVTKGTTKLGTISYDQEHLHLEVLSGRNTLWYDGYQNGSPNLDPLAIVFEK